MQFVGSGQTIEVTGQQARQIFGLKSTYFTIRTKRKPDAVLTQKPNKKGQNEVIDVAPAAMNGGKLLVKNDKVEVIFDGHGFGHGLGMSQYGAKAMADAGKNYEDILHHYYTDIEIIKWY